MFWASSVYLIFVGGSGVTEKTAIINVLLSNFWNVPLSSAFYSDDNGVADSIILNTTTESIDAPASRFFLRVTVD